jgi:hypothetical protein
MNLLFKDYYIKELKSYKIEKEYKNKPSIIFYNFLIANNSILFKIMNYSIYEIYIEVFKLNYSNEIKYIFDKDYDEKIKLIIDLDKAKLKL